MSRLGKFLIICLLPISLYGQGYNHIWLMGNQWNQATPKARMFVNSNSYNVQQELRKMTFEGTEATISDSLGNFLMSSNGVWIANANNDTMSNGGGLNPGNYVNTFYRGLVIPNGNIILPFPGDPTKYVLFHQTGSPNISDFPSLEVFYSIIDMTLDGGLGEVTSINNSILQDTLSWGLAACRHANGRDWWIIAQKDSSDLVYKILYTPNGISSISSQNLGYSPFAAGNSAQITFSQDGTKFIQVNYDNPVSQNSSLIFSNFDRCTGDFSNTQFIPIISGDYLFGLAFSPSGEFIYTCSTEFIFQINTQNISIDTVATFDGFISGLPPTCCPTVFDNMYLAANGKIYITSQGSVQHIHRMNYPDSVGMGSNVQQHALGLGIWNFRAVPNHPNYYLGAADGTVCDSLGLNSESELSSFQQNFIVEPNPNNGDFRISYLLPQNNNGKLEIFDLNGKCIYAINLPPWSTMQDVNLSNIDQGLYNISINSNNQRINKKLLIIK